MFTDGDFLWSRMSSGYKKISKCTITKYGYKINISGIIDLLNDEF